jgi:rRNA maturation endonuclease Nob1
LRRLASALLFSGVTNASRNTMSTPNTTEFYSEQKWCEACKGYVRFLMSVNHSFCVTCGGKVRLFSRDDSSRFGETVQRHKWQAS